VLLLRFWGLVPSELPPTRVVVLVNIVGDMTGQSRIPASPFSVTFENGKAYVASETHGDETIEWSKPQ
jgi:hypothetical protein